jgi:hypothetical protein
MTMNQITFGYTENEMNAIYIGAKKAVEWQQGDDISRVFKGLTEYLNTQTEWNLKFEVREMPDTDGAGMPEFIS